MVEEGAGEAVANTVRSASDECPCGARTTMVCREVRTRTTKKQSNSNEAADSIEYTYGNDGAWKV